MIGCVACVHSVGGDGVRGEHFLHSNKPERAWPTHCSHRLGRVGECGKVLDGVPAGVANPMRLREAGRQLEAKDEVGGWRGTGGARQKPVHENPC